MPLKCVFDMDVAVSKTKNLSGRDIKEKVLKTALHKAISDSHDIITDDDLNYAIHETKKEVTVPDTMFV